VAMTLGAARPAYAAPAAAAAVVALCGAVAVLANAQPLAVVALTGLCVFAFFPRVCRLVFLAAVVVGPVINPPVLGLGAGRVYVVQVLMLCTFAGALALAARNGLHRQAAILAALTLLLVAVETVGRAHAGIAWVYRPLQVFFVAFAVRSLFRHQGGRALALALAWGATAGCTLAAAHALVPAFDPFRISRPDDIPFVSAIGSFARATGAFTYPNNLGTFAAYAVLLGAAAWLFGRPALPPRLAVALMGSGAAALLLAGSRAAGLGLVVGVLYLTYKAAPGRRVALIAAEAVVGLLVVTAVLSSPTAREVSDQRIETATGSSITGRIDDWRGALADFRASPLVGTGASESRTDNFWMLYLAQAGVAGAVLLLLLARTAFGRDPDEPEQWAPELKVALVLALCVSGLLQDSLGQTLASWFLGAVIGLSALAPPAPATPTPAPAPAGAGAMTGPPPPTR
jgi:hypothetical protein